MFKKNIGTAYSEEEEEEDNNLGVLWTDRKYKYNVCAPELACVHDKVKDREDRTQR